MQDRELVSLSKYLTHIAASGVTFQTFEHKVCQLDVFLHPCVAHTPTELEEGRFSIGRCKCTWTFKFRVMTLIYLRDLFLQDLRAYSRGWKCIIATVYDTA